MDFGENLKQLRIKKKMKQSDLAELFNVGRSTVTKWETGENIPRIDVLDRLASVLDVSADELLGRDAVVDKYKRDDCTIKLLSKYSKLNDFGKTEALKRVSELTEIPRYTNTIKAAIPIAAHNEEVIDEKELKLMREDIEDL